MNENKGKMSTLLIIALVIIIILLSTAIVFLIMNKTSPTDVVPEGNTTNVENIVDDKDKEDEEEKAEVITKEMTAEQKYKIYAEGMKKSLNKLKGAGEVYDDEPAPDIELGEYSCGNQLLENGITSVTLDYTGAVYLKLKPDSVLGKKYGDTYKIASNMLNAGTIECYGQEGDDIIWAIDENGKIFYKMIYTNDPKGINNTLEMREYDGLKNIIYVDYYADGCNDDTFAVDIEGNIHPLYAWVWDN